MAYWDMGMNHIVDVDGQLLAIDAEAIDALALLAKARRPIDRQLWQVRAGERFAIQPRQVIALSRDEVLFFESAAARDQAGSQRLAA